MASAGAEPLPATTGPSLHCGDGVLQDGERCDDGERDCPADYGACLRCDPDCRGRTLRARDLGPPSTLPATAPTLFCEARTTYVPPLHLRRRYDPRGWLLGEERDVDVDGRTDSAFTFRYHRGLLQEIACDFEADGRIDETRRYQYDHRDRLARITTRVGGESYEDTYQYEGDHLVRRETTSQTTTYQTDPRGRLLQMRIDAAERSTRYTLTYDPLGRVATVTRAARNPPSVSRYLYDARGRLDRVEHPFGVIEHIQYDEAGHIVAITNQNGDTGRNTTYTYDCLAALEQTAPPVP